MRQGRKKEENICQPNFGLMEENIVILPSETIR